MPVCICEPLPLKYPSSMSEIVSKPVFLYYSIRVKFQNPKTY
ncbi:hypothetical protein C943_01412 [Mariniradius saccharolyticus AK6]|uniref:Uncharacterized protein n=1 Tax=Mariniradius saccharolyticus AK6 TaxID=1239962 RepID=M7X3T3_9BACT|nr:hypothetical protein C943_01412 [Mariniradius saccharolyticus AK6]